jgi:hypothetical protein
MVQSRTSRFPRGLAAQNRRLDGILSGGGKREEPLPGSGNGSSIVATKRDRK